MPTSKQQIIAKAHKNPEYASMSARKLSPIIGVSQPVISLWRKKEFYKKIARDNPEAAKKHGITRDGRRLPPKVTVESVRRKWEEKYAALNRQYEYIAGQLIEMAKNADRHRNNEKELINEVIDLKTKIGQLEKKSWISRLFNSKV